MLEQTPCTVEAACPLRLLGGAHRCVLDGIAPEPRPRGQMTTRRATWVARSSRSLAMFAAPPAPLLAALQHDPQTNEVGRAASLGVGLAEITRQTGLPVRLFEIGASGGLLSRLDRFWYESDGRGWGDPSSAVRFESDGYSGALPFGAAPTIVDRRRV